VIKCPYRTLVLLCICVFCVIAISDHSPRADDAPLDAKPNTVQQPGILLLHFNDTAHRGPVDDLPHASKLVHAMFKDAEVVFRYEYASLPRALRMAKTGPHTCAFSFLKTDDRLPIYHWIGPIQQEGWAIFGRGDDHQVSAPALEEIKKRRIIVHGGGKMTSFLRAGGFDNILVTTTSQGLKILYGREDRLLFGGTRTLPAKAMSLGFPAPKMLHQLTSVEYHLLCSRDINNSIITKLQQSLERIKPLKNKYLAQNKLPTLVVTTK